MIEEIRNPSDASNEKRLLVFVWGNPTVVHTYSCFLDWLCHGLPCRPLVVTENSRGVLLWAERDVDAVTLADINIKVRRESSGDFGSSRQEVFDGEFDEAAAFLGEPELAAFPYELVRRYRNIFAWLIDRFLPAGVMTWNGGLLCQAALADAASRYGLPVNFIERGVFPDTFWVDPMGVNYASSVAGERWHALPVCEPDEVDRRILERFLVDYRRHRRSVVSVGSQVDGDEIRRRLQIPARAEVLLFPLQIESDTNIRLYSPLFRSMKNAISAVETAIQGREALHLIVKPHPENLTTGTVGCGEIGNRTRIVTDIDLHSLISVADAVVTINSTVGLEACCFGRPVVTLGDSLYSSKGFTDDVRKIEDLPMALWRALESREINAESRANLERFLAFILKYRLFPLAGEDRFGARKTIVDWIGGQLIPPAAEISVNHLSRFTHRTDVLRHWIEREREGLDVSEAIDVVIGCAPGFLESDLFGRDLRTTTVLRSLTDLGSALLRRRTRSVKTALVFGRPTWKRKAAMHLLRPQNKVNVA